MNEETNINSGLSHNLKIKDLISLSFRNFRVKPIRTVLTVLGMAVGIGTVIFLTSLGYGLQYILIGKLVTTEDSLITLEAFYPTESQAVIQSTQIDQIKNLPEVSEISSKAEFMGEVKYGQSRGLIFMNIVQPNYFRLSGTAVDIGSELKDKEPGIILSSKAAALLNLPVDPMSLNKEMNVTLYYQNDQDVTAQEVGTTQPLLLAGIIKDDAQPPFAIIAPDFLQKAPPFYKKILAKAKDINYVEKLRDSLIAQGYLISARIDLVNQAKKIMNIITIILMVFGITALIVAAIGMFNTMVVAFLERIYEVGIMKSLGATDRDVKNLFLVESSIMGFMGGASGVILGISLGQLFNWLLNLLSRNLGGKPFTLFITPYWFAIATIILSTFIGLISGFWPARRASHLSPKEAFVNK